MPDATTGKEAARQRAAGTVFLLNVAAAPTTTYGSTSVAKDLK
jgi:hypothetical protein